MNRGISFLLDPSGDFAILPGDTDLSAPTGNSDLALSAIGGYLWDSALRAGKTVRAYGPLMDLTDFYYVPAGADPAQASPNNPLYIPIRRTPFEDGVPQAAISKTSLAGNTDLYFREYDMNEPDIYRSYALTIMPNYELSGLSPFSQVQKHQDTYQAIDRKVRSR